MRAIHGSVAQNGCGAPKNELGWVVGIANGIGLRDEPAEGKLSRTKINRAEISMPRRGGQRAKSGLSPSIDGWISSGGSDGHGHVLFSFNDNFDFADRHWSISVLL